MNLPQQLYDMDYVLHADGRIFCVSGSFISNTKILGYNVYSPDKNGDRSRGGRTYRKNHIEDDILPADVMETYEILDKKDIVEYFEPIQAAHDNSESFRGTIWFDLYKKLCAIFGTESIGVIGSAICGLHLGQDGKIRNDVDYVIEGLHNVPRLKQHMREVREDLGFTDYSIPQQYNQYLTYKKIFQNEHNSFDRIIKRRWTGMLLSRNGNEVLNTFRFRDKGALLPFDLLEQDKIDGKNIRITGTVSDADQSNLFPRMFTLKTATDTYSVCSFWWKFASPVRDGDEVTICGDIVPVDTQSYVRLTSYRSHWLHIS